MCQVETVEEIACPLPKPGRKRGLRCLHFLERALEIVPLHVYDRYIRLRCSLEVHALRGVTQAAAECMVFASARPQDLNSSALPGVRGNAKASDAMVFISFPISSDTQSRKK